MSIETKCPSCERLLRVSDEHAGKQARCPACNTIYVVPGGDAPSEASALDADDHWFMKTPEGQVYGPVTKTELDRWLAEGRISAECTLRIGNDGDWRPADEYYGALSPKPYVAPPASPAMPGPARAAPAGPAPRMEAAARADSYSVPHRGGIILTLGILSWVFSCPIFSVMAWVMGASDLREMRAGRMDSQGMGLTQAGHIMGVLYSLLWIVVLVIGIFVFALLAAI